MVMVSLRPRSPGVMSVPGGQGGGGRSHPVAREGARAGSVDDDEPDREDDPADGCRNGEDPAQRSAALIVPGGSTDENPGVVQTFQDGEGPEEQEEEPGEGDEDPQADAAREVVGLGAQPQAGDGDWTPAEQADEGDGG